MPVLAVVTDVKAQVVQVVGHRDSLRGGKDEGGG